MRIRPFVLTAVFLSLVGAGYAAWLRYESERMSRMPWTEVTD
ncbi:hypothetical protein [Actinomyces faecalis]|nr:hypothetical protein [Actinomyces faecalis]